MNFIKKWYTYQKERFPILMFGVYVLCIVIAVFGFASLYTKFNNIVILPMFIVGFLQFLMVRIVDEFKDYEEDCKYRPYRPVPRGVVTLEELKILFIICAITQISITIACTKNITYLTILWLFFAIMTKGFFIKKVLDKHLLLEVTLDEIMMPILVIFLLGFTPFEITSNTNVWKILVLSYLVSWIVEIARKIRSKEQEETGVRTYTAVYGIPKAILILSILETLLALVQYVILGKKYIIPIIVMYAIMIIINILFLAKKKKKFAKIVELSANIYIMLVYLSMLLLII